MYIKIIHPFSVRLRKEEVLDLKKEGIYSLSTMRNKRDNNSRFLVIIDEYTKKQYVSDEYLAEECYSLEHLLFYSSYSHNSYFRDMFREVPLVVIEIMKERGEI